MGRTQGQEIESRAPGRQKVGGPEKSHRQNKHRQIQGVTAYRQVTTCVITNARYYRIVLPFAEPNVLAYILSVHISQKDLSVARRIVLPSIGSYEQTWSAHENYLSTAVAYFGYRLTLDFLGLWYFCSGLLNKHLMTVARIQIEKNINNAASDQKFLHAKCSRRK